MKAASFVIGILVGMVLLVVAVGGGLAVALSVVTVGQIEDTVGTDIIDDASDANGQTLLDLVMSLMDDLADPSSITINLFREEYGLKLPEEISGIDISVLFDYPISEVANHLGDVVNNMTLRDVDEFLSLGLEEKYPDLSVLISNLDNNVDDALNNILASIDSSSMTLYSLETGFGITLGENRLFDELYHTPLSEFGEVMDLLPVGTLTGADSDLFLPLGENTVYGRTRTARRPISRRPISRARTIRVSSAANCSTRAARTAVTRPTTPATTRITTERAPSTAMSPMSATTAHRTENCLSKPISTTSPRTARGSSRTDCSRCPRSTPTTLYPFLLRTA